MAMGAIQDLNGTGERARLEVQILVLVTFLRTTAFLHYYLGLSSKQGSAHAHGRSNPHTRLVQGCAALALGSLHMHMRLALVWDDLV